MLTFIKEKHPKTLAVLIHVGNDGPSIAELLRMAREKIKHSMNWELCNNLR